MYTWFYMALGAALFWATALVLLKKGFENISPLWNNIISIIMGFFVKGSVVIWLSKFAFKTPTLPIFIIILAAASFYMLFPYAISKGDISLAGALISISPVATLIFSNLFLKERITFLQLMGIVIVVAGGILITLPKKELVKKAKDFSWVFWGLTYAFLCGIADFLSKVSTNAIGAYSSIFFFSLVSQPLWLINYAIDKKGRKLPKFSKKKLWPTFIGSFVLLLGSLTFFLAFDYGNVSLISPVASIYPAVVVVLAAIFLKERITARQGFGIGAVIFGVALIGFGTG